MVVLVELVWRVWHEAAAWAPFGMPAARLTLTMVGAGAVVQGRRPTPMLATALVAVLVVPVSCVSHGGLEQPSWPAILEVAVVAVLVVPVSCVSHGGLEQPSWPTMLEVAVVAVLVVPVSCVSHGGLEHMRTTLPFCWATAEVTREAASCRSQTNCTWGT